MKIDQNKVKAFKLIEPGKYLVNISDCLFDNPNLHFSFSIETGLTFFKKWNILDKKDLKKIKMISKILKTGDSKPSDKTLPFIFLNKSLWMELDLYEGHIIIKSCEKI